MVSDLENIFQMGNGKRALLFRYFPLQFSSLPDLAFLLLVPSGDGASRQPYARRRIPLPPASLPYRSAYSSCTACRTDIRPAGLKDPAEFPELSRSSCLFFRSRRGTERISARYTGDADDRKCPPRSALHDDAGIHDSNLLCDICYNTEIMCDHDDGCLIFFCRFLIISRNLSLNCRIERGRRLRHRSEFSDHGGKCNRDHNTLTHTAGKFVADTV